MEAARGEGRQGPGSLAASQDMSAQLSITARKLRFSTSNRSALYKAVGLRPRLTERLFTAAVVLVTIVCLVIPNILAVFYFGYLASDQYQAEARFTVRSSTPALGKDQIAKVTGIPQAKIVQGYQPVMPTYQGLLSEEDVMRLIAYVKSLRAGEGGS